MKRFLVRKSPVRILLFCILASTSLCPHVLCGETAPKPAEDLPVLNSYMLAAIKTMPDGGGYDSSQAAVDRLAASVKVVDGVIHQDLTVAKASFCSGATYLVFLRAVEMLRKNGSIKLTPQAVDLLADLGVKDGERVFGRWTANGPGPTRSVARNVATWSCISVRTNPPSVSGPPTSPVVMEPAQWEKTRSSA